MNYFLFNAVIIIATFLSILPAHALIGILPLIAGGLFIYYKLPKFYNGYSEAALGANVLTVLSIPLFVTAGIFWTRLFATP